MRVLEVGSDVFERRFKGGSLDILRFVFIKLLPLYQHITLLESRE